MRVNPLRSTPRPKCWPTAHRAAPSPSFSEPRAATGGGRLGCTFCGYFNDTRDDVTNEDLHAQWAAAKLKFDDFKDQAMVKVYTSGSLLEDREIPVAFQETVLRDCADMDKELIVESRCEQLTEEKLAWATSINPDFTVAIGLEAYDDEVLRFHVNKGFTTKAWDRAVANLKKFDLRIKTYLMFKPPFMNEADALDHCVKWIGAVAERSDEISVNPMNIQRGTVIDRLHRHNEYRPPWLWSLVEMIRRAHPLIHPDGGINGDPDQVARLIVHPTAGGKIRGSHNCGRCDHEVVAAIERYAVSGSLMEFDDLSCDCEDVWRSEVMLERQLPVPLGLSKPSSRFTRPSLALPLSDGLHGKFPLTKWSMFITGCFVAGLTPMGST